MSEKFKAVRWMRETRTQIDAQDSGLTWNQKSQKTLKVLNRDPLWKKLKKRTVQAVPHVSSGKVQ